MLKKRFIRACFAQLITNSSYLMIHRELNVLRKLQSMGSTKVEIAASYRENTEQKR